MNYLKKITLAQLPTPIQELPHLAEKLGHDAKLYIKRDDLTGLAMGGNKSRKLEYILADALDKGFDTIVTAGGNQSNHCVQTVSAAKKMKLNVHVVLSGTEPERYNGNLLLDKLSGANIHFVTRSERDNKMQDLAKDLKKQGQKPYVIPVGGSNPLGTVGYTMAMFELKRQIELMDLSIDRIVSASSSGGTLAGMVLGAGLTKFSGTVTGISIDRVPDGPNAYPPQLTNLAQECAQLLDVKSNIADNDFHLEYNYLGEGYALMGDLERSAIRTLAQTEGIFIGPVYTGRAMGAMLDILSKGRWKGENILFWHTGDAAALFDYDQEF